MESPGIPGRFTVWIEAIADDPVGQQLVLRLREAVRRSAGLSLAPAPGAAVFFVRIVTMDQATHPGQGTVYSIAWSK